MKLMASTLILLTASFISYAEQSSNNRIDTLIFAEDPWPPYIIEADKGISGIAVEITKEAFKRLDIAVTMKILPWKRCLKYAEYGEIDGIPLIKTTPERKKYMLFSQPYLVANQTFFYLACRDDPIEWQTLEDLSSYSISKQTASEYGQEFNAAVSHYHLEVHNKTTEQQALNLVLRGRVDLFLGNDLVTQTIINSDPRFKGKFKTTHQALNSSVFRIGLSKKSKAADLLPKLNEVLTQMKEDGSIAQFKKEQLKSVM